MPPNTSNVTNSKLKRPEWASEKHVISLATIINQGHTPELSVFPYMFDALKLWCNTKRSGPEGPLLIS